MLLTPELHTPGSYYSVKDGTTAIANAAFLQTNVETLRIPNTLQVINNQTFRCDTLKTVQFDGTVAEMATILGCEATESACQNAFKALCGNVTLAFV